MRFYATIVPKFGNLPTLKELFAASMNFPPPAPICPSETWQPNATYFTPCHTPEVQTTQLDADSILFSNRQALVNPSLYSVVSTAAAPELDVAY